MKRRPVRPARLIPLLLASGFLVLLTWRIVRVDPGDPPAGEPATQRIRSTRPPAKEGKEGKEARKAAKPAAEERRNVDDAGPDPSPHALLMPVAGVDPRTLHGTFSEARGGTRSHDALDILAPRGTLVLAAGDGIVRKLFTSVRGGLTVYQFDLEERYCYYYAHLDGYAPGLHEGQRLRKGELVGYVGTTGNARADAPHLHFAVTRLDPDKKWWGGTAIDPYPLLVR